MHKLRRRRDLGAGQIDAQAQAALAIALRLQAGCAQGRVHRQQDLRRRAQPLLTRDGEQSLPGGLFVQSGAQRSSTALYLPSGRSGPGYIVSLDVQAVATVTLRRRDVSLTFRVEPAFVEVNRA